MRQQGVGGAVGVKEVVTCCKVGVLVVEPEVGRLLHGTGTCSCVIIFQKSPFFRTQVYLLRGGRVFDVNRVRWYVKGCLFESLARLGWNERRTKRGSNALRLRLQSYLLDVYAA